MCQYFEAEQRAWWRTLEDTERINVDAVMSEALDYMEQWRCKECGHMVDSPIHEFACGEKNNG